MVATCKATEQFIAALTEDALQICVFNNRKTIKVSSKCYISSLVSPFCMQVDDILLAIENNQPRYQFLNEAFSGLK